MNWIYDGLTLATNKVDRDAIPVGLQAQYLDSAEWNIAAGALSDIRNLFEPSIFFVGTPYAGQVIWARVLTRALALAVNFGVGTSAAPQAFCVTNPSVAQTFTVWKKSGVTVTQVGTITFSTAGVANFTAAAIVSFEAGDVLYIVAPNPADEVFADIAISLCASL